MYYHLIIYKIQWASTYQNHKLIKTHAEEWVMGLDTVQAKCKVIYFLIQDGEKPCRMQISIKQILEMEMQSSAFLMAMVVHFNHNLQDIKSVNTFNRYLSKNLKSAKSIKRKNTKKHQINVLKKLIKLLLVQKDKKILELKEV